MTCSPLINTSTALEKSAAGTKLPVGQMEAGTFEPVEYLIVYCDQLVTTECTAMRELNAVPDFSTPKTIWISFRITAPTTSILGLPASNRRCPNAFISGLYLRATNAGI